MMVVGHAAWAMSVFLQLGRERMREKSMKRRYKKTACPSPAARPREEE